MICKSMPTERRPQHLQDLLEHNFCGAHHPGALLLPPECPRAVEPVVAAGAHAVLEAHRCTLSLFSIPSNPM